MRTVRVVVWSSALLAVHSSPVSAQDARAIENLAPRIDSIFADWDRPDSPGCALGISRHGELIYARGYGMSDLEHDIPITPSSIFHVASVSKQFAAMAVAMLAREGRLSLDEDVRTYLPELHDFGATITIRHLIHHTSGLRDHWDLLSLAGWRAHDLKTEGDVFALAIRQRDLNFEPGTEHLYSNTGYALLAIIVRRVTGQSLREWTDANIFQPLGMEDTHFHDDYGMIVSNRTSGYSRGPHGRLRISNPAYEIVGPTSLFTTIEDLARWDANFDHRRVGGDVIDEMHTRGVLKDGSEIPYAYALAHGQHRGLPTVSHSGADAGYRAHFLRFPDQQLTITTLCNLSTIDPARLATKVADVVLGDDVPAGARTRVTGRTPASGTTRAPQRPPPLTMSDLRSFEGDYYSPELETMYRIVVEGETLLLRRPRFDDRTLEVTDSGAFTDGRILIRFIRQGRGDVAGITVSTERVRNLRFTRVR